MSLLHPAAARAGRVDDRAVDGCGAIHAVKPAAADHTKISSGGGKSSSSGGGGGGGGGSGSGGGGVAILACVALVLFACMGAAVGGGRWSPLAVKEKASIPTHKFKQEP